MLVGWLLLAGCGDCAIDAPLDYTGDVRWLCRPGMDGACPTSRQVVTLAEDGGQTTRTETPVTAPDVACFGIYPTLDLRLGVDLHHDLEDLEDPAAWAADQIAPFAQVCDLWVPVYRQVTIGTYAGRRTENKEQCHASAQQDVDAAFDVFLGEIGDRPFALVGHSQGGQRIADLLRERVDGDPTLSARLVAAYPIGWPVAEDSFSTLPSCSAGAQTGCVVGYRSVNEDGDLDAGGAYQEGDTLVCVNPASPEDPVAIGRLAAFTMAADSRVLDHLPAGVPSDALLEWPDAFDARCREDGSRALEVRWRRSDRPPVDLDGLDVTLLNGTHILDMNLGATDLAADLRRRTDAWLTR